MQILAQIDSLEQFLGIPLAYGDAIWWEGYSA